MTNEEIRHYKAIQDAKELADFVVTREEVKYPAFHVMSDARECAVLLRELTGKAFYCHPSEDQSYYYVA